jgi:hypothetical protein
MQQEQHFGRALPFGTLVTVSVLLFLHHLYVRSQGEYLPVVMFGLPMVWMLALGGTVYPPVFYALGKYGRRMPIGLKVVAAVLGLAGFGVAFGVALILYP